MLLDTFARCTSSGNKNVRQGIAALLVNLAVLLGKIPAEELEFKARVRVQKELPLGMLRNVGGAGRAIPVSDQA